MGIEGAVRRRRELDAYRSCAATRTVSPRYVEKMYAQGKTANATSYMEFDDVIDPGETRSGSNTV
jgi:acetyl-CoA carboxylase carboxyltransferase component